MNRQLLDPFQSLGLPEIIEEYLEHGVAKCIALNRRGTLLAAGTAEGEVVLWDFDTRGVASILKGHTAAVTSICWSRNGKQLVSGSANGELILWDVLQGTPVAKVSLPGVVVSVSMRTRPPYKVLASMLEGAPQLVDMEAGTTKALPCVITEGEVGSKSRGENWVASAAATAIYNKEGTLVFVGQAKGLVTCVDPESLMVLDAVKLPFSSRVTQLVLTRKGDSLLTNCQDRVMRMFDLGQMTPAHRPGIDEAALKERVAKCKGNRVDYLMHKPTEPGSTHAPPPILTHVRDFRNAVESSTWRAACFSNDGEHVVGGVLQKDKHRIYLWNRVHGKLERILEGPKEGMEALAWHPLRSILVSVSTPGKVHIWAKIYDENWSAFAPDFTEVDHNVEYVEREDEFDVNERPDEALATQSGQAGDASVKVDITTIEEERAFSSDEDGEEQLHYLPVVIEPEVTEATPITTEGVGVGGVEDDEDVAHGARGSEEMNDAGASKRRKAGTEDDIIVNPAKQPKLK